MAKAFNLPPVPASLKSITPYLQRVDELRAKEPVMAYWCAYYAAQVGISLRVRESAARDLLSALLTELEALKREVGPNDAIDVESASAAYVENFALRVFQLADNEDRAGRATRGTAKKFLAASNFLEVLQVFPKSEIAESNEDKIRYAKWKAVDISRAFREGRVPVPGPASQPEPQASPSAADGPAAPAGDRLSPSAADFAFEPVPGAPKTAPRVSSPTGGSTLSSTRRATPPPLGAAEIARANELSTPPRGARLAEDRGEGDDGTWSTAATPGSAGPGSMTPSRATRFGAADTAAAGHGESRLRSAWVGDELESAEVFGASGDPAAADAPDPRLVHKAVHFTPPLSTSETGPAAGSPPTANGGVHAALSGRSKPLPLNAPVERPGSTGSEGTGGSPTRNGRPRTSSSAKPPASSVSPTNSAAAGPRSPPRSAKPDSTPDSQYTGYSSNYPGAGVSPPRGNFAHQPPAGPVAPPRPAPPPLPPSTQPIDIDISPARYHPSRPAPSPPSSSTSPSSSAFIPAAPPLPPPPPVPAPLTPMQIAKAQKHCRFAISALDYEDAEQAKRDLRAALAVLEG